MTFFAFIDWCPGLEKLTALQGVYLYTLKRFSKLPKAIGDEDYKKQSLLFSQVRSACKMHLDNEKAKQPVTPYMRHYVTEAMIKFGLMNEAVLYLKKFWGGMLELGADTFWEAYIHDDLDFLPYEDSMINSLCHA